MARVTYVKHARQRFAMVPVLDADGNQVRTKVMRRDGVTPKTTKRGHEVYMRQTVQDRTRPLANLKCDFPNCTIDGGEILPGTSYMHITPRSGPYGGTQRSRHSAHPQWQVWEYSYSRSAQVARTQNDMHEALDTWEPTDEGDFDSMRDELSEMASEQRDEQSEALDNMPEQLQDGSQAQEYLEALESWVDEIEGCSDPDAEFLAECETCNGDHEIDCETCGGDGNIEEDEDEVECEDCEATGSVTCPDCGGEEAEVNPDWIDEARDILSDAIDGCDL